jgi:uncharacterized membrane protein
MTKILISMFLLLHMSVKASGDFEIIKVLEVTNNGSALLSNKTTEQLVRAEVISDHNGRGETILINNQIPDNQAYAVLAEKGRKYLISVEEDQIYITDYYREPMVIAVIVAFLFLVLWLGRWQGFNALVSLALTGLSIIYVLMPGLKMGYDPILLAIIVSAFSTAVTMLLVAGWTHKSLAATIGTTGGVAAAGIIATLAIKLAPLSGLASTEAQILLANQIRDFDFQGMLAAGVIIASLGAAMDVAISIASAVHELREANPLQSSKELFFHAMNIGRDIMGTMINTLILAYTGSSIPLFLLLQNETGLRLLNMEVIATEIVSAVVGSIGLLLAIPITAFVASFGSPTEELSNG